jgi:hypothetical protein
MTPIETWNRLSTPQQLSQWRTFLEALDTGDAGWHAFYGVLMLRWERGDAPTDAETPRRTKTGAAAGTRIPEPNLHAFSLTYGAPPF